MIKELMSQMHGFLSTNTLVCVGIMVFSSLVASFSQILLKTSAKKKHKSWIFEYLNWNVIISYGLLVFTMFANMIAYWGVEYRLGVVLGTSNYLFIMILGRIFLNEKISKRKLIGTLMIMAGIIIFSVF